MQKAVLARPGAWLCLLGSALALVAFFFLPYATYTPTSENLGNCLTSCTLDLIFPTYSLHFEPIPWAVGALLLLLLSIAALAVLAVFFRPPQWKGRNLYLRLTILTLLYYLDATFITLFFGWVGEAIADTSPNGFSFLDAMSLMGIGAWLIPLGLLLALAGDILERREIKAGG